jgi:hypothetical protein
VFAIDHFGASFAKLDPVDVSAQPRAGEAEIAAEVRSRRGAEGTEMRD